MEAENENLENSQEERIEEIKIDTTNPFNEGVTYDMFLENVKGNIKVDTLLRRHNLSNSQKEWIKKELINHKKNKK